MDELPLRRRDLLVVSAATVALAGCQDGIARPPQMEIASVDAPEEVVPGEDVSPTVEVVNEGSRTGIFDLVLSVDDVEVERVEDIEVEGTSPDEDEDVDEIEFASVELSPSFVVEELDDFDLVVETDAVTDEAGDSGRADDETVSIAVDFDPDQLDVAIDEVVTTPDEIEEETAFTVATTVANNSDISVLVDVEFADEAGQAARVVASDVSIPAGESETVDLEYTIDDPDTYDAEVRAVAVAVDEVLASNTFDLEIAAAEPPAFSIDSASIEDDILIGETDYMRYNVINEGGTAGDVTLEVSVDENDIFAETETLDPGSDTNFHPRHTYEEPGEYDLEAQALDPDGAVEDAVSHSVTAREPDAPEFVVDIDALLVDGSETDEVIIDEEELVVRADVTNEGEEAGVAEVRLFFDGTEVDTDTTSELGTTVGDNETPVWLSSEVSGDTRDLEIAVETDDDTDETEIFAREPLPSDFSIASLDADFTESIAVTWRPSFELENAGEESGSTTAVLEIEGEMVDSEEVSLSGGKSTSVTLNWEPDDVGEYDFRIDVGDDDREGTVTIEATAEAEEAVEDAEDSLSDPVDEVIAVIESDFVDFEVGPFDRSALVNDLETVADRVEAADQAVQEALDAGEISSGEADDLDTRIEAVDETRAAISVLGASMERFADAVIGREDAVSSLEQHDYQEALSHLETVDDDVGVAKTNRENAVDRLEDDVPADWLTSFDDDLLPAIDETYVDILGDFDDEREAVHLDLAWAGLDPAREALAETVSDIGGQLEAEFDDEPWRGVSLDAAPIRDEPWADDLALGEDALAIIDTSGTDAQQEADELDALADGLGDLAESMDNEDDLDADRAYTRATDAAITIELDAEAADEAADMNEDAQESIGPAQDAYDDGRETIDSIDAGWLSAFDDDVSGHSVTGVFDTHENGLEATASLIDGIDRLLDAQPAVETANAHYDDAADLYEAGDFEEAAGEFGHARDEFGVAHDAASESHDMMTDAQAEADGQISLIFYVGECRADHFTAAAELFLEAGETAVEAAETAADGDVATGDALLAEAEDLGDEGLAEANEDCL